ncbi:MAG: DNA-processing protein DprA [Oscillospiraceae bacterium]|nr:DNA-processing protein DprA [Oscillospiraceae bacterium]
MENQDLYWIWLTQRKGLGAKGQRSLAEDFGSPAEIWAADEQALLRAGVTPALRRTLLDKDLRAARAVLERCEQTEVRTVVLTDAVYPSRLRLQEDAPILLYYKGTLPGEERPIVGLVGAREADEAGLRLARRFGAEIAACGGTVCTGMAKGVDAAAAWGALEGGGSVVGVLGCGPDIVYPRENAELFARVPARGCLLSEYPPGTPPDARRFPVRNRLISALSDGVAVIRAAERSGSLITARWAAEQGRDVFAVPGAPDDPLSRGCNALLRNGAFAAESGWDVLERYRFRYPGTVRRQNEGTGNREQETGDGGRGSFDSASLRSGRQNRNADTVGGGALDAPPEHEQPRGDGALPSAPARAEIELSALTPIQRRIAEALRDGPLQLDALIDRTGIAASLILPQLTLLQIKKRVAQRPGKIYELS